MQPLAKNIDFQVLSAQYNMRDTSIRQITRILLPVSYNALPTQLASLILIV